MRRTIFIVTAVFALACAASSQNLRRQWEFVAPSGGAFPKFFSSTARLDIPLNDMLKRHFFASPGPSPADGNPETFWTEWDALATAWIDTSRNKSLGHDYNVHLRGFLLDVPIDSDGYVHSYEVPQPGTIRTSGSKIPDPEHLIGKNPNRWAWDDPSAGQEGWTATSGATTSVGDGAWNCIFTEPDACITRKLDMYAHEAPLVIVKMSAARAGTAYFEWTTDKEPEWSSKNRAQFPVDKIKPASEVTLQMWAQPGWRGKITGLRIRPMLPFPADGIEASFDLVETSYDTRQVVNNTSFILASHRYYMWTGDEEFLKLNLRRLRAAAHYLRSNLQADALGMLVIPYWGHEGTSGVSPSRVPGFGLGSDGWDALPMGYKSTSANAYYVAALRAMGDIEDKALVRRLGTNPYGEFGETFRTQAKAVAKQAGTLLWDPAKKRFIGCEDSAAKRHDYGFTFVNLEALHYGLGDAQKATDVFSWLNGSRKIDGDTSTGADIYHWVFAPRSTTLRNSDWYVWTWPDMKKYPFGSLVQDGGAAAYVSYYDIMDRIKFISPDDAYDRLSQIMTWYYDVWDAGGYDEYYRKQNVTRADGKLGALGLGAEYTNTVMLPCAFLYGFLGVNAGPDGMTVAPKIPSALSYVGVSSLSYHGAEFTITATRSQIKITCTRNKANKTFSVAGRHLKGLFERTVDGSSALITED